MKPLYIFDIDGTLALIEHRRHFVESKTCQLRKAVVHGEPKCACVAMCTFKPDWPAFYAACVDDLPNHPVINTMVALRERHADVWFFSGRSDEVRAQTEAWLQKHCSTLPCDDIANTLVMRKAGDYTADHILKKQWLDRMLIEDRERLVAVFDDRDRVVKMWRDNGVACFQVAPGEF